MTDKLDWRRDVHEALEAEGWEPDDELPDMILRKDGVAWCVTNDAGDSGIDAPDKSYGVSFNADVPAEVIVAACRSFVNEANRGRPRYYEVKACTTVPYELYPDAPDLCVPTLSPGEHPVDDAPEPGHQGSDTRCFLATEAEVAEWSAAYQLMEAQIATAEQNLREAEITWQAARERAEGRAKDAVEAYMPVSESIGQRAAAAYELRQEEINRKARARIAANPELEAREWIVYQPLLSRGTSLSKLGRTAHRVGCPVLPSLENRMPYYDHRNAGLNVPLTTNEAWEKIREGVPLRKMSRHSGAHETGKVIATKLCLRCSARNHLLGYLQHRHTEIYGWELSVDSSGIQHPKAEN
ncbi:hypothetical protein [Streptomyces sp. NPDC088727]|uniref:hypothetical protein n=1 Tax=Streptomyces sp. NPDC088727 TaxID=3365875 RepID=UPI003812B3E9